MKKTILATGGAGYIGSHVVVELMQGGYDVVILDNFENSDPSVVDRIGSLVRGRVKLVEGDVRDPAKVKDVLERHGVWAVVHLAGKKAVAESVAQPLLYFRDNLIGAVALLGAMRETGVERLVFSSSATVYGAPESLPVAETARTGIGNPYGRTKLMIEEIIDDLSLSWPEFAAISLRYFNPVGAHRSGLIGEDPRGIPNNLFPYVAQAAAGERAAVQVFGDDYDTRDGTGLRDYIHVADLARGHVAALDFLSARADAAAPHRRVNLGTGQGHTVLEVIAAFSKACGRKVPYGFAPRRAGDAAASVADPSLAGTLFGWRARHGLDEMCRDHWAFQQAAMARKTTEPALLRMPARVAASLSEARPGLGAGKVL